MMPQLINSLQLHPKSTEAIMGDFPLGEWIGREVRIPGVALLTVARSFRSRGGR